jgi:hypothetical protein
MLLLRPRSRAARALASAAAGALRALTSAAAGASPPPAPPSPAAPASPPPALSLSSAFARRARLTSLVLVSSADLRCQNALCGGAGGPCVCRLSSALESNISKNLHARLLLETSVAVGPFKQRWRVKKLLHEAQTLLGLQLNITGVMGTRTKCLQPNFTTAFLYSLLSFFHRFQTEALAQLVLQVSEATCGSEQTPQVASGSSPSAPCLPSVVALDDDVETMERVKLNDNRFVVLLGREGGGSCSPAFQVTFPYHSHLNCFATAVVLLSLTSQAPLCCAGLPTMSATQKKAN